MGGILAGVEEEGAQSLVAVGEEAVVAFAALEVLGLPNVRLMRGKEMRCGDGTNTSA